MTTTTTTPNVRPWRKVKLTYVSLAAGLMLAAGAAVSLAGASSSSSQVRPVPADRARHIASWWTTSPGSLVFYLVGDSAQADRAASIEAESSLERLTSGVVESARSAHILRAGTR